MATTSPPEAWFVNLRDSNNVDLGTNTVSDPTILTYTFNDLDKGSVYRVRVAGNNSQGLGDYSDFVSNETIVDREYCVECVECGVCVCIVWSVCVLWSVCVECVCVLCIVWSVCVLWSVCVCIV